MHQLPLPPASPRNYVVGLPSPSDGEKEPNENTTHNPNSSGGGSSSASGSGSSQPDSSTEDGLGVITYRARSSSLSRSSNIRVRPQSYCSDSQQSVRSFTEQESNSESCSEITTPVSSPPMVRRVKETRSEGLSSPGPRSRNNEGDSRRLPLSENGAAASYSDPGKNNVRENKRVRGVSQSRGEGGRRIVSPVTSKSGAKERTRPRMLSFGSDVSSVTSAPATAPALHNDEEGRFSIATPHRSKPIALNATSPPSVDERLSVNVNEEGKERDIALSKHGSKSVSRRNTIAGNNLLPYKQEDPKSGIANVRESLIGDRSPHLRRSIQNSRPANYQKSPPSRRQHNTPAVQKDTSENGGDPAPDSEPSPLLQREDIRIPKPSLLNRGSASPPLKPSSNDPKQSLSDRGSASPSLKPSNDPITRHASSQPKESPGSVTVLRNKSGSSCAPSISSSAERTESSHKQVGSATLPRRIKHTVAYKESSPLARKSKEGEYY